MLRNGKINDYKTFLSSAKAKEYWKVGKLNIAKLELKSGNKVEIVIQARCLKIKDLEIEADYSGIDVIETKRLKVKDISDLTEKGAIAIKYEKGRSVDKILELNPKPMSVFKKQ